MPLGRPRTGLDASLPRQRGQTRTSHTYPHWGSHMGSRIIRAPPSPQTPRVPGTERPGGRIPATSDKVAEALGAPGPGARLAPSLRERMGRCRIDRAPVLPATRGQADKLLTLARLGRPPRRRPDVVFVSPCGFGIPRTLAEMPLFRPGWYEFRAVREGPRDRRRRQPVLQPPRPAARGEPRDPGGGAPPWCAPAAAPRQRWVARRRA
jgi:hypothetical protein